MGQVIGHRAVLHIPRQYWDGAQLHDADLQAVLPDLTRRLEAIGVTGWYETEAFGNFQGRRYPELQITVFVEAPASLEQVFRQWIGWAHSALRQEVYAWEMDGALVLLPAAELIPKRA